MFNHYPTPTFKSAPTLTVGRDPLARVQCASCKALFLPYVDRGDGTPLRYAGDPSFRLNADGTHSAAPVDYEATTGPAVATSSAFANCPECGAVWNNVGGRPGAAFAGIKGRMSTNACDSICAFGTGTVCKCSCGGLNHGSRA